MINRRQFSAGLSGVIATPALLLNHETAHAASKRSYRYGPNKLDWYPVQDNAQNAPILVFVHGGAWALGNRGQVNSKPEHYTKSGYHFVSVSYTLLPAANAQTQALQVGKALEWVGANAARFGGDPTRIALMGHSAGCHLSSLATLTGAAPYVRSLICNDTRAYDLPYLAQISGGRLPTLYAPAFSNRKMWNAWSPISYTGLKQHPPTLVAWSGGSGRDKISKRFADQLERDGTEIHRFDGKRRYNHFSINRKIGSERGGLTQSVDRFLQDTLNRTA
jgi:acetyl esterase/lipase